MKDMKVVCYGLVSDGEDPPTYTPTAFPMSLGGIPSFNLYLNDTNISSTYANYVQQDEADFDMQCIGAVSFGVLCGPPTGQGGTNIWGRSKFVMTDSVQDPTAAQMTCDLAGELFHHAPAVNTAAVASATATAGSSLRVTGFGFTITAVAAIAAPLTIVLEQDFAGTPVTIWSGRYLLPAGQSKEVFFKTNFTAAESVRLTVQAPGATNFVTATIEANNLLDGSPS